MTATDTPTEAAAPDAAEPAWWSELLERGVVHQTTDPSVGRYLQGRIAAGGAPTLYAGFDPTADSLHIGGLVPVLGLRRFKDAGCKPIALVGGATGRIGDPSGKSAERTLLDDEAIEANIAGISGQLERLLQGTAGEDFLIVNNLDWTAPMTLIPFLRDVGKHFSVNTMVSKDSVKSRLENRDQGISYTEFSYMILQALDFLHLYETCDCRVQVGGSDQWGNITAGTDLIRHRHHGADVFGVTFPLVTMSDGRKFGKSERGNVWLDPARTHPYFMHKYFFDLPDAEVVGLLETMTLLPLDEIADLTGRMQREPQKRAAQTALGRAVTALVHGEAVADACVALESAMHADDTDAFEQAAGALDLLDAEDGERELPVTHLPLSRLAGEGLGVLDLAVATGLFASKGEARREIGGKSTGFRIDGRPVDGIDARLTAAALGGRRVIQVRKSKKNKRMVCFTG